jgi:hypothetical protein
MENLVLHILFIYTLQLVWDCSVWEVVNSVLRRGLK